MTTQPLKRDDDRDDSNVSLRPSDRIFLALLVLTFTFAFLYLVLEIQASEARILQSFYDGQAMTLYSIRRSDVVNFVSNLIFFFLGVLCSTATSAAFAPAVYEPTIWDYLNKCLAALESISMQKVVFATLMVLVSLIFMIVVWNLWKEVGADTPGHSMDMLIKAPGYLVSFIFVVFPNMLIAFCTGSTEVNPQEETPPTGGDSNGEGMTPSNQMVVHTHDTPTANQVVVESGTVPSQDLATPNHWAFFFLSIAGISGLYATYKYGNIFDTEVLKTVFSGLATDISNGSMYIYDGVRNKMLWAWENTFGRFGQAAAKLEQLEAQGRELNQQATQANKTLSTLTNKVPTEGQMTRLLALYFTGQAALKTYEKVLRIILRR